MYKSIPKITMLLAIFLYIIGWNFFINDLVFYTLYVVVPLLGLLGAIVSSKIEGKPFMLPNIIFIFAPITIAFLMIAILGFV